VSGTNVVSLRPLDDDEAFGWLNDRLDGRTEWGIGELARQFRWPRARLRRRLANWTKAGRITQHTARKGKVIIAAAADDADGLSAGEDALPRQAAVRLVARAFAAEMPAIAQPSSRPLAARATGAVLFATAFALGTVGLVMNARFSASFGQTAEAAIMLASIGLAIDLLAVMLPSVAMQLWHRRSIVAGAIAATMWVAALSMSLLAATGFASTHIGDSVAERAQIAVERTTLSERIDRLRLERAGTAEARAVATIESQLQEVRPAAERVWSVTAGCTDVTRVRSGRACAPVLQLREALATAQRRDAIDAQIRDAEARLSVLPSIAAADPQATTAAEIIAWLSAGHLRPTPQDISWLRVVGLALTPSLAGLIGMLALSLAQARRP
jgi:hypothetical protein